MAEEIRGASAFELAQALAPLIAQARAGTIEFRVDEGGIKATLVAAGDEPIS